jgi:hypothetical protein
MAAKQKKNKQSRKFEPNLIKQLIAPSFYEFIFKYKRLSQLI